MYINRIIESVELDPREVVPNKKNWRRHPKHQKEAMDKTLENIGWIQDVIVNKTTGNLIDGHLRLELALKNKERKIPVKFVELTENEEIMALTTFDPLSSMAETNRDALNALIASLQKESQDTEDDVENMASQMEDVIKDSKIAIGAEKYDPVATEWQGMPEFKSEDKSGFHQIIVHFETLADLEEFASLVEQNITDKTKAIWFPKREPHDHMSEGYVSE